MRVLLMIDLSLREATVLKHYRDKHRLPSLEVAAERIVREFINEPANVTSSKNLLDVKAAGSA